MLKVKVPELLNIQNNPPPLSSLFPSPLLPSPLPSIPFSSPDHNSFIRLMEFQRKVSFLTILQQQKSLKHAVEKVDLLRLVV